LAPRPRRGRPSVHQRLEEKHAAQNIQVPRFQVPLHWLIHGHQLPRLRHETRKHPRNLLPMPEPCPAIADRHQKPDLTHEGIQCCHSHLLASIHGYRQGLQSSHWGNISDINIGMPNDSLTSFAPPAHHCLPAHWRWLRNVWLFGGAGQSGPECCQRTFLRRHRGGVRRRREANRSTALRRAVRLPFRQKLFQP